jgi:hypothetical protein
MALQENHSMKSFMRGQVAAGVMLIVAAVSVGCQDKAATVAQPGANATPASMTPEESFEAVVASFREGIEDVKIGFMVPDGSGGHSRMTGASEVSHLLIKPEREGGQYKGIITVHSESYYSMKKSTEPAEVKEQTENSVEDSDAESDTEVIDPALVDVPNPNRSAATKHGTNEVTIASEKNSTDRKYELVYEDGRWVLTTKLDPKTEGAIQNAFERALDAQSES